LAAVPTLRVLAMIAALTVWLPLNVFAPKVAMVVGMVISPDVIRLPPSVIVLPVFDTPVPPLAPFRMPAITTAPAVGLAGVNPVVPPLHDPTEPPTVAKVPDVGKVTFVSAVIVNVVAKAPDVVRLPPKVIVFPVLATPVPPLAPSNVPLNTTFPGVALLGRKPVLPALNVATVPPTVATVPDVGRLRLVEPVTLNVSGKAPDVVRFPPSVMVLPLFATPVPPLAPTRTPFRTTLPVAPVLGVKPVVPALKLSTPAPPVPQATAPTDLLSPMDRHCPGVPPMMGV
jgi:hypothetical protein